MSASFDQMQLFLRELDKQLKCPVDLYLIGGAAITLAYDDANRTADLDFIDPPNILIKKGGVDSALAKRFHVYVSALAQINFSVPDDWKSHCTELFLSLRHIHIRIPSAEDIVLGKLARFEPKDIEDILALRDRKKTTAASILARLKKNKKELRKSEYRNNARLFFRMIFGREIVIAKGEIKFKK